MAILTQHASRERSFVAVILPYSNVCHHSRHYAVIEHTVTVLDSVDDAGDLECSDEEEEEEL